MKILLLTFMSLMTCLALAGDANLVLYLTFDEETPADSSPKGIPIASFIEPEELVKGVKGKAWLFDEATNILINNQTFKSKFSESTFCVWLKDPSKDGLLYEEGGGTNGCAVTIIKNEVQFATRNRGKQTTIKADYPDDGKWHFIAAVFDNGTMRLYMDGELKDEENKVPGIRGHSNAMGIGQVNGASSGGVAPKFKGIMDELRIYRRALSSAEIEGMYQEVIKILYAISPLGKHPATWGSIKWKY
jgi:hypothetical protein